VIDAIVHNAGINVVQDFASTNRRIWDAISQTNLAAPFFLTQALAPLLNPDGASVTFVSSLAAMKGVPRQAAYSASKAGLLALTRCLAVEIGSKSVRVNAVCPSLVVSPQSAGLTKALRALGEEAAPASLGVLAGMGTLRPEHVTDVVLWLASSGSRCITGQIIVADAGRSL
jgi:NAD(P)-dependent dehydrogenase (short-subunit alcohol dehydrogenase family)